VDGAGPRRFLLQARQRLPLIKDKDFAHGRLQPYVGVGPSLFISRLSGDLGNRGGRASDTSLDVGADARGGVMVLLTHVSAFS